MAIKGLTDKQAAFPSLGTLRKGEKKPDANRPGKDLTYFRFVSDDPLACKMFEQAYPDENSLRNINVFLPHKTTDENMDAWIEKWVAGGLVYRSDGETVVLWRDEKGRYSTTPKPDPAPEVGEDGKRSDGSGQVGRLSVIVPDLGRFVTITVMTTSKHDIINLTRQLRGYEALRGDLRGIPFVLKRRQQNVSTPAGGGKRARREKWLLSIETQPAWSMAQLGAMEQAALPAGEIIDNPAEFVLELPEIVSPFDESIDEPAIPQNEQESELDKHFPRQEQPANRETHKAQRPLTPEQVKTFSTSRDKWTIAKAPSEQQATYAFTSLSKACDGDDDTRHIVNEFLFGVQSQKELTTGQCSFLIDWCGAKADNNYAVNEDTVKEIRLIVREVVKMAGQTDMFEQPAGEELPF